MKIAKRKGQRAKRGQIPVESKEFFGIAPRTMLFALCAAVPPNVLARADRVIR